MRECYIYRSGAPSLHPHSTTYSFRAQEITRKLIEVKSYFKVLDCFFLWSLFFFYSYKTQTEPLRQTHRTELGEKGISPYWQFGIWRPLYTRYKNSTKWTKQAGRNEQDQATELICKQATGNRNNRRCKSWRSFWRVEQLINDDGSENQSFIVERDKMFNHRWVAGVGFEQWEWTGKQHCPELEINKQGRDRQTNRREGERENTREKS